MNIAVVVDVALAEQFVNNLTSVIFIDALLGEEDHHFVLVDEAVAVEVNLSEFVVEFALLLSLVYAKRLI